MRGFYRINIQDKKTEYFPIEGKINIHFYFFLQDAFYFRIVYNVEKSLEDRTKQLEKGIFNPFI